MPDLAAQIREQLDTWNEPTSILEAPETLTEAEFADLRARFLAAQKATHQLKLIEIPPSPFDLMRRALLATVDACAPDALPPNGCGCDGDLKLWIQTVIADKLGIEEG